MSFLFYTSLLSAGIQFFLLCWFILKRKYRIWSETSFLLFLLFSGSYCLLMSLSFIESNPDIALLKLKIAFISANFAPMWAMFFSIALFRQKFTLRSLLLIIAPLIFLPFFWNNLIMYIHPVEWGWCYHLNQTIWRPWIAHFVVYGIGMLTHFHIVQKTLRKEKMYRLERRISYIIYSFLALLILLLFINLYSFMLEQENVPIFSSFFFIPSVFIAYALMGRNEKKH